MTQDPGSALSRSLNAIDSMRRRALATFVVFWLAAFASLLWLSHVTNTTNDIKRIIEAAVVALAMCIFLGAFSVMLYVARMTRRTLRAIEIAMTASARGTDSIP